MNEDAYRAVLRRLGVEASRPSPDHPKMPAATEEVTRRVVAFRRQIEEWAASGGVGVPLLVLPDAPPSRLGRCISCGAPIPDGWRCALCLRAVSLALGMDLGEGPW